VLSRPGDADIEESSLLILWRLGALGPIGQLSSDQSREEDGVEFHALGVVVGHEPDAPTVGRIIPLTEPLVEIAQECCQVTARMRSRVLPSEFHERL